jgi:hypothetical protein
MRVENWGGRKRGSPTPAESATAATSTTKTSGSMHHFVLKTMSYFTGLKRQQGYRGILNYLDEFVCGSY